MLGVHGILKHKLPDLLISGINHGANMGEDVTYSGTVAAAIEGTLLGIPSIAVSLVGNGVDYRDEKEYAKACRFTQKLIDQINSLL